MAQASNSSATHLAGTGVANPTAEILSGQMLLQWLAERLSDDQVQATAQTGDRAVGEELR
jgi:isocitrate/isopropylmalate dehydrogenase